MPIILSINCVLSYIENSFTCVFVPETIEDIEKLSRHQVSCKGQFKIKVKGVDMTPLLGHHMTIEVQLSRYKFSKKSYNGMMSQTFEGNKLKLINIIEK